MKPFSHRVCLLLVGFASVARGFAPTYIGTRQLTWTTTGHPSNGFHLATTKQVVNPLTTTTTAFSGKKSTALAGAEDGSDRGNVLLAISFVISVWLFSIPPELRRAHFCTADYCLGTTFLFYLLCLRVVCVFMKVSQPYFQCVSPIPHLLTLTLTDNRAACYDCVTLSEWVGDVKDYYANGGGISWDFTVAQETKDLWAGKQQQPQPQQEIILTTGNERSSTTNQAE